MPNSPEFRFLWEEYGTEVYCGSGGVVTWIAINGKPIDLTNPEAWEALYWLLDTKLLYDMGDEGLCVGTVWDWSRRPKDDVELMARLS